MPLITINPRAIDTDILATAARTQLLTNSTITTTLDTATYPKRIGIEVIEEGVTAPYIVLALASVVYESAYNDPMVNALLDVGCYSEGAPTTTVRALMLACLSALIDTSWPIPGMTLISAGMDEAGSGFRSVTTAANGIITRGRQATIRIRALKN